ncbi:uncharacterized protein LOC118429770 [Branchiostoma floridae]|uniref:Uncharacterized protein LOC118429770 n=1 Tax=Branchiostoma floridae TaxID=7739 RepID=A0A9J7M7M2_BRAFL|nr:uncharacterized protein LOC118429770 [Branchiostoma floridae]
MFKISNRLVQASEASSPREHLEEEHVRAGRDGETGFVERLRNEGGLNSRDIFCDLRVPDEFQTRKHEIDVVVLTAHGVYCIEVKNWSGELERGQDGQSWIQKRLSANGKGRNGTVDYVIQHHDVVAELKVRTNLLRNHMLRAGCGLKQKYFHSRVVLLNPHLHVEDGIASDPQVVMHDKCAEFIGSFQQTYLGMITDAISPALLTGQLSYAQIDQVRNVLKTIGTWDVVDLHGGKRLIGDFKSCKQVTVNRKETELLEFSHQRNGYVSAMWALLGYMPQVSVTLYDRGGAGWIWHSSSGVINVPYNAEIVFRICGEEADAKIPANDIDRITLSI